MKIRALVEILNTVSRVCGVSEDRIKGSERNDKVIQARRLFVKVVNHFSLRKKQVAEILNRDPALITRMDRVVVKGDEGLVKEALRELKSRNQV